MFTIRKEQITVLHKVETEKFVNRAVVHVKEFFPKQFESLGTDKLREIVRHGIERADHYRITAKAEVLKYIDFMVLCGRDFDTAPELRWAGEILNSENPAGARIEMLALKVKKHIKG